MVLEFAKLEYHLELKFKKLKFLEVLPPWHYWGGNWVIKKNNVVLELGKLEYTKLEYHIIFFNHPISTLVVPRWKNF